MDQMESATTRVITALTANQKICIYGDYDVDGTCATALLYMFLKELDANVEFYIPEDLKKDTEFQLLQSTLLKKKELN